jgi:hypothetical protein
MPTGGGKKQAFKGEHRSRHGLLWVGLEHDGGGEIRQFDEREIKRVTQLSSVLSWRIGPPPPRWTTDSTSSRPNDIGIGRCAQFHPGEHFSISARREPGIPMLTERVECEA